MPIRPPRRPRSHLHDSYNLVKSLALLERLHAFYARHPNIRTVLCLTMCIWRTVCGTTNTSRPMVGFHAWAGSTLAGILFSRQVVVHGTVPVYISLLFSAAIGGYETLRDVDADSAGWVDRVVVVAIAAAWIAALVMWEKAEAVTVFRKAGVKGLLVRSWRREYEGRLKGVMDTHEASIQKFCSYMLSWLLATGKVYEPEYDDIDCWGAKAGKQGGGSSSNGAGGGEVKIRQDTQKQLDIEHWTHTQILLFRPPEEDRETVKTFWQMLPMAQQTLVGLRKSAREIVEMEREVVEKMKESTREFTVLQNHDVDEVEKWCEDEWDRGFCDGRSDRLVRLTDKLLALWQGLREEVIRVSHDDDGARPLPGERLPQPFTEIMRWFVLMQKKEQPLEWELELEKSPLGEGKLRSLDEMEFGLEP